MNCHHCDNDWSERALAAEAKVVELETGLSIAADLTAGDRRVIRDLEDGIATIAASLGADPVQDTAADLATIEAGLKSHEALADSLAKQITELEMGKADAEAGMAASRDAARQLTEQNGELMQRVGELEVENARLRRDGGETSATIAAWQTETFGTATTTMDRLCRSWDAMDVAWAAVRDCDLSIQRPNLSRAIRAAEELAELIQTLVTDDTDPKACAEVADVQIVLAGIAAAHGREQAVMVDDKMAMNRARKWTLTGDGHGQHVKEEP